MSDRAEVRRPKTMRVKVEFSVVVPVLDGATNQHVEDWLRFAFGDNGILEGNNPYVDEETPEPIFGTFKWDWQ